MTADPGSLANLHDLALPPPVSFWPPAAGVCILAAGLAAALGLAACQALARHRHDAYRRAAAAALDGLPAAPGASPADVFAILKRTALVAFPREAVAPLTGKAFAAFLTRTAGHGFDDALVAAMAERAYRDPALRPEELRALVAQARLWVRGHRPAAGEEG